VARGLFGAVLQAAAGKPVELTRVAAEERWWAGAEARETFFAAPAGKWPVADLGSQGWDGYLASRSRNLRSQIRRRLRAMKEAHEIEVWRSSSIADAEFGMEVLFRLHGARWRERAERSSFDNPGAHAFHRDFARAAAEQGWLRLYLLQADGESVAAWYGWRLGSTVSYYQAGYDPGWASQSVGSVLFAESIRLAAEEGAERYDMLLGDEAFKLRYATRVIDAASVTVARRTSRAWLRAAAVAKLKPMWRWLPKGMRTRLRRG
jgi:CelD/BcsL family acetyltransferase involved in cellulose biosynthesis